MTRFCDAKVCNTLVTDDIDDQRIQSDYKCTKDEKNPEGKNSLHLVVRLRGENERQEARHRWQRDHQDPEHFPHSAHEPQHVNWRTRDTMGA